MVESAVVILTALAVMFMVSGQAGDFGDWINDTQTDASCSLQKQNGKTPAAKATIKTYRFQSAADSNCCEWAETTSGGGGEP